MVIKPGTRLISDTYNKLIISFYLFSPQPYREVFEYVIENFRTYKPLLSSIKQEYEGMLSKQSDTIKSLKPLKV